VSPETEAFLEAVRDAEDPTRADQERVRVAVRTAVAGGLAVGVAAGGGTWAKLTSGFGWTALKGSAVVLCVVAGAKLAVPERFAAPSAPAAALSPAARPRPVEERARSLHPTPEVAVAPAPSVPAPARPSAETPPARTTVAEAQPDAPSPVLPEVLPEAPPSVAESAREELALLSKARAALRAGDAASALSALDAKARGDARFTAERRALRVQALCAAGRVAEARAEAAALLRSEPSSLQRAAVARSCAASESETAR
jgi:hypothetical protein